MKRTFILALLLLATLISFAQQKEQITMSIDRNEALPDKLEKSQRALAIESKGSRGITSMGVGLMADLSTRALFQIIDKAKDKRVSEWKAPACRDCFYREPSFMGPLDPTGLHFHGITLHREVLGADGQPQTAILVRCSLPEDKLDEYLTSRRFGLQVDTLAIDLSKVKAKYTLKKNIAIQISIAISATWMDEKLEIHQNVPLGTFNICLPSLKYDPKHPVVTYNAEQARRLISGSCFFVPRSYSAFVSGSEYKNCWSAGEFEAAMTVHESTGKKSGQNATYIHDYLQKSLPAALQQMMTNENIVGESVVEIIKNY